jgi:hypothetical protein
MTFISEALPINVSTNSTAVSIRTSSPGSSIAMDIMICELNEVDPNGLVVQPLNLSNYYFNETTNGSISILSHSFPNGLNIQK